MAGKVYNVQPMPPAPENTDYFEFGPLRIGVEYRKLDPATIEAAYDSGSDDVAEIRENSPEGGFTDEGLSFHIESMANNHEYLRFDAFADDPHYHYVDREAGTNNVVDFDAAANGPMIAWVLECLETRLGRMLEHAGAKDLAKEITPPIARDAAAKIAAHLIQIGQPAQELGNHRPDSANQN